MDYENFENTQSTAEVNENVVTPNTSADEITPAELIQNAMNNKKFKTIALIAVIALAVVGITGSIVSYFSPSSIAERYVRDVEIYGDVVAKHKYSAYDSYEYTISRYAYWYDNEGEDEYFELMSDWYDEDIESWNDLAKYCRDSREESLEDDYGDYKITIEATKVKSVSARKIKSELESTITYIKRYTDFDADDINDAKVVTVKVKLKGEDDSERETVKVYLVKVGMNPMWKVLTCVYDD